MYKKDVGEGGIQMMEVNRNKIVKNFTTTSTDYELLTDTDIRTALETFFTSDTLNEGVYLNITVYVESNTQIKINNQSFYNDFIEETVFDVVQKVNSIKIKDTGIVGTIEIIFDQGENAQI